MRIWDIGLMHYLDIGMMCYWDDIGMMRYWDDIDSIRYLNIGIMRYLYIGIMHYSDIGVMRYWNTATGELTSGAFGILWRVGAGG